MNHQIPSLKNYFDDKFFIFTVVNNSNGKLNIHFNSIKKKPYYSYHNLFTHGYIYEILSQVIQFINTLHTQALALLQNSLFRNTKAPTQYSSPPFPRLLKPPFYCTRFLTVYRHHAVHFYQGWAIALSLFRSSLFCSLLFRSFPKERNSAQKSKLRFFYFFSLFRDQFLFYRSF